MMDRGKIKIVVGLGFGDEGKGLTTSYLCHNTHNPIVVRANGGHQAGHTVVVNGHSHVFSNFGSGTLQGHPTFWSEYCTFSPIGVLNEFNALKKTLFLLNPNELPKLYVHPLCPVATPFDKQFNCVLHKQNQHGSCGVGFGATLQRQEDHYKLFVQDLFHEKVLHQKLMNIKQYYEKKGLISDGIDVDDFLYVVNEIRNIITVDDGSILANHTPVFEGAQGVLLDQDFGFFPNVTRSNTTSKNALELIIKHAGQLYQKGEPEIYYITRAYQTRHGNGYMSNESVGDFFKLNLTNTEKETNVTNDWQGDFRKSVLDADLLNYALTCDNNFSSHLKKNLVITCVDQTGDIIPVTIKGVMYNIPVEELANHLSCHFANVYISRGQSYHDISVVKDYEEESVSVTSEIK